MVSGWSCSASRSARRGTTRLARPARRRRGPDDDHVRIRARGSQHARFGSSGSPATTRSSGSIARLQFDRRPRPASGSTFRPARASAGRPARHGPWSSCARSEPPLPAERLARYGPTAGDRVRLGDTDLWVRVDDDRQAPGDEPIWGYAKTIRPRSAQGRPTESELDAVIAGVLVLDPVLGVIKADIGIKDGRIVGVGRAGNDRISDGIELLIGPHTQPIMGYGLIATPGAIDSHVHLISPELLPAALSGGVTTLITAGFEEPPWAMARTLAGIADWPLNVGLQACARAKDDGSLDALLEAGACGFKIHEDYGAYPELIDAVLRYADAHDVSVSLHTDGLHECAELEDTVAAIAGRTVHAYHVEGSGGGHVPDVIGLVREPNIICSSTTPTVPWGVNAAAEQVPMIVLNHGASFAVARTWTWCGSGSTRPRWPPKARSTSSARSPSSTPTHRAWAG